MVVLSYKLILGDPVNIYSSCSRLCIVKYLVEIGKTREKVWGFNYYVQLLYFWNVTCKVTLLCWESRMCVDCNERKCRSVSSYWHTSSRYWNNVHYINHVFMFISCITVHGDTIAPWWCAKKHPWQVDFYSNFIYYFRVMADGILVETGLPDR